MALHLAGFGAGRRGRRRPGAQGCFCVCAVAPVLGRSGEGVEVTQELAASGRVGQPAGLSLLLGSGAELGLHVMEQPFQSEL